MAETAPATLVLHSLRLKGFADTDVVAETLERLPEVVLLLLKEAEQDGFVVRRDGRRPGWALTAAGRLRGEALLRRELDDVGLRSVVEDNYRRFRLLNPLLLQICTDWQIADLVNGTLNDHINPEYDSAVIERLMRLDTRMQPICADLGRGLTRFSGYGPRLRAALAKVEAGDPAWLAGATIDSYHTVWFELHEDLLATLGRSRSEESSLEG